MPRDTDTPQRVPARFAPTRARAPAPARSPAPLPAHRQDTVSSTLVPGTLPAAGSSAPGDAIPARPPPPLRAAASRAAEAGAPGGGHGTARHGHGHGGPAALGGPAPGTGPTRDGSAPGDGGGSALGPRPGAGSRLSSAPPGPPVRGRGLGSTPQPGAAEAQPRLPPRRALPPGPGSVLFRCRRSRSVGRAIYSERRPRRSRSRRPAPPRRRPPPRPRRPQPGEEAGEGTARVFTAETRRSPRAPQPRAGGPAAGGGCCRCPHWEGGPRGWARWIHRVPGLQPATGGNATLRVCCCFAVPRPAQTARGGRRWPPRGWGARPSGRWSGCSWLGRRNALLPAGTHGRSLTPA